MLSLTREDPQAYQIRDHSYEVRQQLTEEAKAKLVALQTALLKIEQKKVKNVSDQLRVNELTQKIQKANRLIERLTHGEHPGMPNHRDYVEKDDKEK